MIKPADYDRVTAYGEFTPLELGGHICQIMSVEETTSSTGKDMLVISLDTAPQDKQPGYYMEQWKNDDRPDKKWGCRVFQMVLDKEGRTNRGLKTFITAVEKSNPGFQVQWGDGFGACFKNRLVGGVFGREQYQNSYGDLKWSTKCVQFRSVEAIQKGVDVPEDRYLNGHKPQQDPAAGFGALPDIPESDMPF